MSELLGNKEARKAFLKGLIQKLHQGGELEEARARFGEALKGVSPAEIAQLEEELIGEGMPAEEVHRLCEVHLALFKESLEKERGMSPAGHPIQILMEEHRIILGWGEELRDISQRLKGEGGREPADRLRERLDRIVELLKGSENHYLREENVLFPYLEKHGITQPPAIMWMEHDKIREIKKGLYQAVEARQKAAFSDFALGLERAATALAEMLSSHFYKENNVLFPTALQVIAEPEWGEIRRQFDQLGYCCFQPALAAAPMAERETARAETEGEISLETGSFSTEELEAILSTLPLDITFVDRWDRVRYFSQSKDRIFPRTKAVIGREVRQCHPQKSLHLVNQILEDFRAGRREWAHFWIQMGERLIYIRYFPVRNREGDYLGCLEVTQDITDIKEIKGEKRLL